MKTNPAMSALRHHVTRAIARGEAQAITEVPATPRPAHTPGPWKVRVSHNGALRGYSIEHEDETLRSIVASNWEHELCEEHGNSLPNARLIAAAPDLIDALEAVLPDLEHYVATHGPGPDKRLAIARAAIAKARC